MINMTEKTMHRCPDCSCIMPIIIVYDLDDIEKKNPLKRIPYHKCECKKNIGKPGQFLFEIKGEK